MSDEKEKGPSLFQAVVNQGTFLEKFSQFIMRLPDLVNALNSQGAGLVGLMQRVSRLEAALRIAPPQQLPSGRPQMRVVQQAEVTRFEKPAVSDDFDYDNEEDAELGA